MKKLFKLLDIFEISFFTIFFIVISIILGHGKTILSYFTIALIHELAHLLFCLIYKVKIKKINIMAIGLKMEVLDIDKISSIKQVIIYLAGPMSFLIVLLLFNILYNNSLISNQSYLLINKLNFAMAFFNMIPIYPLDGYKILKGILQMIIPYKKALITSNIISIIFFLIFILINIISFQLMWTMFLLIEQIKNIKNFKIIYKYFLVSKTSNKKYKKYRFIKNLLMYKDVNNYKVEKGKIISDLEIASLELKTYI